jgi:hypothetical protein
VDGLIVSQAAVIPKRRANSADGNASSRTSQTAGEAAGDGTGPLTPAAKQIFDWHSENRRDLGQNPIKIPCCGCLMAWGFPVQNMEAPKATVPSRIGRRVAETAARRLRYVMQVRGKVTPAGSLRPRRK